MVNINYNIILIRKVNKTKQSIIKYHAAQVKILSIFYSIININFDNQPILGIQKCSLENFRSIEEKRLLLDEAIALHDGNAITRVGVYRCVCRYV